MKFFKSVLIAALIMSPADLVMAQSTEVLRPAPPQSPFHFYGGLDIRPIGQHRDTLYFGLVPRLGLDTKFRIGKNREMSVSAYYFMFYYEFLDEDNNPFPDNSRSFDHYLDISTSVPIVEKVSFESFFEYNPWFENTLPGDNGTYVEFRSGFKYAFNKATDVQLDYQFLMWTLHDVSIGPDGIDAVTDPRTTPDETGHSTIAPGSQFEGFDPFGSFSNVFNPTVGQFEEDIFFWGQGVQATVSHMFPTNTHLLGIYHMHPQFQSNNDNLEFSENWLFLRLTQKLWKNAKGYFEYRVRARHFDNATTEDGITKRVDFRHRYHVDLQQKITDYLTLEGWLRIQDLNSNKASADDVEIMAYLAAKFSF